MISIDAKLKKGCVTLVERNFNGAGRPEYEEVYCFSSIEEAEGLIRQLTDIVSFLKKRKSFEKLKAEIEELEKNFV